MRTDQGMTLMIGLQVHIAGFHWQRSSGADGVRRRSGVAPAMLLRGFFCEVANHESYHHICTTTASFFTTYFSHPSTTAALRRLSSLLGGARTWGPETPARHPTPCLVDYPIYPIAQISPHILFQLDRRPSLQCRVPHVCAHRPLSGAALAEPPAPKKRSQTS